MLAALLLPPLPALAGDITLEAPLGGWRNSQGKNVEYTQPVSYPAVVVSHRPEQPAAGRISGAITAAPKSNRPATLIVNGIALPQRIDDDGRFSRPYSFGAGSNSVEIRSPDGRRRQVQFVETDRGRSASGLKVILSWDSDATDLDLHILTPDGGHVFYGDRVLSNGAALDVDVTTGYGPEIVSMSAPLPGTYLVYVNYYGDGDEARELTVAQVAVVTHENTPAEKQQVFRVPLRKPGELTLVSSFVLPER